MNNDVAIVLLSALLATLNPSLLAAVTVMLLLPHPKRLMLGYLLGAYTTSIAAGLVIVFSLQGSSAVTADRHVLSPGENLAVGVLALAVAFVLATGRDARLRTLRERRKTAPTKPRQVKDPWHTRMLARGSAGITFAVGAAVSLPGVTYLNALGHIARLNPPIVSILLLVIVFCLMQQILLEGALLASTFAADRTQNAIAQLKAWLARHGHQLATIVLSAVGALLTVRGVLAIS